MQITSKQPERSLRRERGALGLLFVALLGLSAWLVARNTGGTPAAAKGRIACDAERVRGGAFVNGGHRFEGGQLQSRERARSGKFSCKMPANGEVQFGLTYTLSGVRPGEAWRVSVWRFKDAIPSGKLVAQALESNGLYYEVAEPAEQDEKGWEKLELFFFIPYKNPPADINVYVYTDGLQAVFFDDLLIERIDHWAESRFQPTRLRLSIKDAGMAELEEKRSEALKQGILTTGDNDWVDARLEEGDNSQSAKVRLKGDWLDHLQGEKWSLRVKMKPPGAWRQMLVFNLHTPAARHYLHEWVLHRLWEREDVLTTRYDFVELEQNGRNLGIYAYEEHFEKQLVESRSRREGPLVKLAEDGYWTGIQRQLANHGFVRPGGVLSGMDADHAPTTAFNEEDWLGDPALKRQYEQAALLLEQARQGSRPLSRLFDLKRLARYYAVCDAMGAYHGIVWHNQRFYYNPITALLEPVGFDGFGGGDAYPFSFLGEGALNPAHLAGESFYGRLFQDTAFMRQYLAELNRITAPDYWRTFMREIEADWEARRQWLALEFPDYRYTLQDLSKQAAYVHSLLPPFAETSIRAYRIAGNRVLLQNTHTLPLQVVGFGATPAALTSPLGQSRWLGARSPRRLLDRLRQDSLVRQYADIRYLHEEARLRQSAIPLYDTLPLPAGANYVFYQLPGLPESRIASALRPFPPPQGLSARQALSAGYGPGADLKWLTERPGYWVVPRGKHRLDRTLVIPDGKPLLLEPGAEIDQTKGAALIVFAPVQAFGTSEMPIVLRSSDGSGQGLQVIGAGPGSAMRHVYCIGLGTLQKQGWGLTGAVTFYESDVQLADCIFRDNRSEDGLNIVRSEFRVERCLFANTSSDAFDSDFCKGEVIRCRFQNTVNDGLDLSGSVVTVKDSHFDHCGDKGISVGEDSDVSAINAHIVDSNIGMAAKDLSSLYGRNIRLTRCAQGFVAYQKKPEFGPAHIVIENYQAEGLKRLHAIAPGNSLQLVDQLIRGGERE